MKTKCAYCKWYKIGNAWTSMCMRSGCEWENEECIEQDKKEPQDCEYKTED